MFWDITLCISFKVQPNLQSSHRTVHNTNSRLHLAGQGYQGGGGKGSVGVNPGEKYKIFPEERKTQS